MYQVLCGKSLGGQWTFPIASAQHFESNMAREVLLSVARKHLPSEQNVISAIGGGTSDAICLVQSTEQQPVP